MKILIHVTKDIYKRAMMCGVSSKHCAIALAVQDIAPCALVTLATIIWDGSSLPDDWIVQPRLEIKCSQLPDRATEMIRQFDGASPKERLNLPEFTFEVDFPDALVEKIGIEEVKEILEKSETLEMA